MVHTRGLKKTLFHHKIELLDQKKTRRNIDFRVLKTQALKAESTELTVMKSS